MQAKKLPDDLLRQSAIHPDKPYRNDAFLDMGTLLEYKASGVQEYDGIPIQSFIDVLRAEQLAELVMALAVMDYLE